MATGGAGPAVRRHHQPARCPPATAWPWRCGPAWPCADVEFMQFHPTALFSPTHAAAVAVGGAAGPRRPHPRPRRRAVRRRAAARATSSPGPSPPSSSSTTPTTSGSTPPAWSDFDERFPTIAAELRAAGLDPATRLAARSHRRPTTTAAAWSPTSNGATALPGLWAAGEVAEHGRARRQPAGLELAARGHGVRARGSSRRSGGASRAPSPRAPCGPCSSGDHATAIAASAGAGSRSRRRPARPRLADAGLAALRDIVQREMTRAPACCARPPRWTRPGPRVDAVCAGACLGARPHRAVEELREPRRCAPTPCWRRRWPVRRAAAATPGSTSRTRSTPSSVRLVIVRAVVTAVELPEGHRRGPRRPSRAPAVGRRRGAGAGPHRRHRLVPVASRSRAWSRSRRTGRSWSAPTTPTGSSIR